MKFKKFLGVLGSYAGIAAGSAIAAVGINIFLFPYKIAPGGITGLRQYCIMFSTAICRLVH